MLGQQRSGCLIQGLISVYSEKLRQRENLINNDLNPRITYLGEITNILYTVYSLRAFKHNFIHFTNMKSPNETVRKFLYTVI